MEALNQKVPVKRGLDDMETQCEKKFGDNEICPVKLEMLRTQLEEVGIDGKCLNQDTFDNLCDRYFDSGSNVMDTLDTFTLLVRHSIRNCGNCNTENCPDRVQH